MVDRGRSTDPKASYEKMYYEGQVGTPTLIIPLGGMLLSQHIMKWTLDVRVARAIGNTYVSIVIESLSSTASDGS